MSASSESRVSINLNTDSAEKRLIALHRAATRLQDQLDELPKGTRDFTAASKELDKVQKQYETLAGKLSGTVALSMNDLTSRAAALRRELRQTSAGTADFIEKAAELRNVEGQLAQIRGAMNGKTGQTSWKDFAIAGGVLGVVAASAGTLVAHLQQMGTLTASVSDQFADIQKTMGMTAAEVRNMNTALQQMDTRSSMDALRSIASVGGQIGIAKEDMLSFVKAVDMATVALGDEFTGGAEQVANELGSLQKLFASTSNLGPGEAITRIGSAINALGSAGRATAPWVAEFTARIGQLGQFKPEIDQTMGLAASLQELGMEASIAAGGITEIMMKSSKESTAFAKVLGMTTAEFKQMVNSSPNDVILKLAESMRGASNVQIAATLKDMKIESQESVKVLGSLSGAVDMVREKQALASDEFRKGTSLMAEFDIKNETIAANFEKAWRNIMIRFESTTIFGFFDKMASKFATSTEGIKYASQAFDEQRGKVSQLTTEGAKLIGRYEELTKVGSQNKDVQAELKGVLGQLAMAFPSAITKWNQYGEAIAFSTEKAKEAIAIEQARLKSLNANQIRDLQKRLRELKEDMADVTEELVGTNVKFGKDGSLDTSGVKRRKSNDWLNGKIPGKTMLGGFSQKYFTPEEFNAMLANYTQLRQEIAGVTGAIGELSGASLNQLVNGMGAAGKEMEKSLAGLRDRLTAAAGEQDKSIFGPAFEKLKADAKAGMEQVGKAALDGATKKDLLAKFEKLQADIDKTLAAKLRWAAKGETDKEAAKAAVKRIDELKDKIAQLQKQVEGVEWGAMTSALSPDDQRMAQISKKYQAIRDEIEATKKSLGLTKEQRAALDAMLGTLGASETSELAAARKDMVTQKKGQRDSIMRGVNGPGSEEELEVAAARSKYEALLTEAETFNAQRLVQEEGFAIDLQAIRDAQLREEASISDKYRKKELEKEREQQKEMLAARMGLLEGVAGVFSNLNQILIQAGEEGTTAQRAFAIAAVAIDTAKSLSAAIAGATTAAAASGPAAPFVMGGYIASAVATVLGAFAQVHSMMGSVSGSSGATVSTSGRGSTGFAAPSKFFGGATGNDAGLGIGDKYGEFKGYYHANEYVIPARLRNDPEVANFEAIIESKRRQLVGTPTAANGMATQVNTTATEGSNVIKVLQMLLLETQSLRVDTQNLKGQMAVAIGERDIQKLRERMDAQNTIQQKSTGA